MYEGLKFEMGIPILEQVNLEGNDLKPFETV